MSEPLILASGSKTRAMLLRNAGLSFVVETPRIDEEAVRASLQAEGANPRDIADALAEMKARRISERHPGALVIGCDQVLSIGKAVLGKAETPTEARAQLARLVGQTHHLLSAIVVYQHGQPLWRHVGEVRLTMRDPSSQWLDSYVARNWDSIRHSVGCYKLEEEGVRLFTKIEGDYFTVLGLPLLELLSWLTLRGTLAA